jgi:hypothetical protein
MTWIRFGRNEPLAPAGPLLDKDDRPFDLRAHAGGCALLIWFAPAAGLSGCDALLADLRAAAAGEQEAQALVVTPARADLRDGDAGLPVAYDVGGRLLVAYRSLLEFDTRGQPLLFVLDRDGTPVHAWLGACDERAGLREELARRLQSAVFLCPECSVPDPAASRMWDVIY